MADTTERIEFLLCRAKECMARSDLAGMDECAGDFDALLREVNENLRQMEDALRDEARASDLDVLRSFIADAPDAPENATVKAEILRRANFRRPERVQ